MYHRCSQYLVFPYQLKEVNTQYPELCTSYPATLVSISPACQVPYATSTCSALAALLTPEASKILASNHQLTHLFLFYVHCQWPFNFWQCCSLRKTVLISPTIFYFHEKATWVRPWKLWPCTQIWNEAVVRNLLKFLTAALFQICEQICRSFASLG